MAGVVDAIGSEVPPEWLGRRVVAHLGMVPGGYASQAVTDPGKLFALLDGVDFPDAIAAVGTGRTAVGVLESEPVGPTDTVLIPSAREGWVGSGPGCEDAGATVVALAGSREKVERLRTLRAVARRGLQPGRLGQGEHVTRSARPASSMTGWVATSGVGRSSSLGPGGRLVMFGYSAGEPTEFTTADVIERGLTVSWSLGARMLALPGGIRVSRAGPSSGWRRDAGHRS